MHHQSQGLDGRTLRHPRTTRARLIEGAIPLGSFLIINYCPSGETLGGSRIPEKTSMADRPFPQKGCAGALSASFTAADVLRDGRRLSRHTGELLFMAVSLSRLQPHGRTHFRPDPTARNCAVILII